MQVHVELDAGGMLPDAYGKFADRADVQGHLCRRSFPFEVCGIPVGTKALAWVFLDWDSTPVCGFPWIHWCAQLAGIEGRVNVCVPEVASRSGMADLVQGYTSAAKSDPDVACGYVGPCPPDRDHVYTLRVVALDKEARLSTDGKPFWANELVRAARGHVLAEAVVQLPSRS